MAIMRTYICPDCQGQFDFLHHPNDEPPPSHCPLCGADVSGKEKKQKTRRLKRAVTAPAIKTVVSKSADQVYRQLETASQTRQEQAAQMLGVDARTLGSMKMTNMKDNLRVGEMSNIPAPAAKIAGNVNDALRPGSGFQGSSNIPVGLPGRPVQEMNNAMASVFQNHRSMVQATVAAGRKG